MKRRPRAGWPALALVALVVAATAPAWRLLMPGSGPSVADLLQLRCSARR